MAYDVIEPESKGYEILEPETKPTFAKQITGGVGRVLKAIGSEAGTALDAIGKGLEMGFTGGFNAITRPKDIIGAPIPYAPDLPPNSIGKTPYPQPTFREGQPMVDTSGLTQGMRQYDTQGNRIQGPMEKLVSGAITPGNVGAALTGGLAEAVPGLGRVVSGYFGAQGIKGAAESKTPDEAVANLIMGIAGTRGALHESRISPQNAGLSNVPLPPEAIAAGKIPTEDYLKMVLASPDIHPVHKQMAQQLLATGDLKGKVININPDTGEAMGVYIPSKTGPGLGETRVSPEATSSVLVTQHEAVHPLVELGLQNPSTRAALQMVYDKAKTTVPEGTYGMKSLEEFATELYSNPAFTQALKFARSPDRGFVDKIIDVGMDIIGRAREKGSLLPEARIAGENILATRKAEKSGPVPMIDLPNVIIPKAQPKMPAVGKIMEGRAFQGRPKQGQQVSAQGTAEGGIPVGQTTKMRLPTPQETTRLYPEEGGGWTESKDRSTDPSRFVDIPTDKLAQYKAPGQPLFGSKRKYNFTGDYNLPPSLTKGQMLYSGVEKGEGVELGKEHIKVHGGMFMPSVNYEQSVGESAIDNPGGAIMRMKHESRTQDYSNQQNRLFNAAVKNGVDRDKAAKIVQDILPNSNIPNLESGVKKVAPVKYIGDQPGFGSIKGFRLYNLTEDVEGLGVKNSTISEHTIKKAGYDLPEEVSKDAKEKEEKRNVLESGVKKSTSKIEEERGLPLPEKVIGHYPKQQYDVEGFKRLPYDDIHKFVRNQSRDTQHLPTNPELAKMGYSAERIQKLEQGYFGKLRRDNPMDLLEAVKGGKGDTVGFARKYIRQKMAQDMWIRQGFRDVTSGEGEFYDKRSGEVGSRTKFGGYAMQGLIQKSMDLALKDLPIGVRDLLVANAMKRSPSFDTDLTTLAKAIQDRGEGFEGLGVKANRFTEFHEKAQDAFDIAMEGLTQSTRINTNFDFKQLVDKVVQPLFDAEHDTRDSYYVDKDNLSTMVRGMVPPANMASSTKVKPGFQSPGWDELMQKYYSGVKKGEEGRLRSSVDIVTALTPSENSKANALKMALANKVEKEGDPARAKALRTSALPQDLETRTKAILENKNASPYEKRGKLLAQPGESLPWQQQVKNVIRPALSFIERADRLFNTIDVGFDMLDGGKGKYNGPLMNHIRKPLDTRWNLEQILRKDTTSEVKELAKKNKIDVKGSERIDVYMKSLEPGGVQRMIDTGVALETIEKIQSNITKGELEVAQALRRAYDKSGPQIAEAAKDADGVKVRLVDNYTPWMRDYDRYEPQADELQTNAKLLTKTAKENGVDLQDVISPQPELEIEERTTPGSLITRLPKAKSAIKMDALGNFERYSKDYAHYVTSRKFLKETAKLVRSEAFKDVYGDLGQQYVIDFLNNYARQGRYRQIGIIGDLGVGSLRRQVARGILAYNPSTMLIHLSNIPYAIQRAGVEGWSNGMNEALTERGQAFLKEHFQETYARGGGEPAIAEITETEAKSKVGKVYQSVENVGFALPRFIDQLNSQATVLGIYMNKLEEKELDSSHFDTLPVDQDAVEQARVLSRRAVASPIYKDVPQVLSKGGDVSRTLFQFGNTPLDQWSNIRYDLAQTGIAEAFRGSPKAALTMIAAVTLSQMTAAGIRLYTRKALHNVTGEKSKVDRQEDFIRTLEDESIRKIPLASQLSTFALHKETGVPAIDIAAEPIKAAVEAMEEGEGGKKVMAVTRAVGAVGEILGVPGSGIATQAATSRERAVFYRSHNDKLAKEEGKPIEKMSFDERLAAEEEMASKRSSLTGAEKTRIAEASIKLEDTNRKALEARLDGKEKNWLKSRGLSLPGFGDTIAFKRVELHLTDEEKKQFRTILLEEYRKGLAEIKSEYDSASSLERKRIFNKTMSAYGREARGRMKEKMMGNSNPDSGLESASRNDQQTYSILKFK